MKFLILSLLSINAWAGTFIVHGPCKNSPSYILQEKSLKGETVGDYTVRILSKYKIDFKGNEAGINQIEDSPIGQASLEVISNTHMRAYGWCFAINGKTLESYPSQVEMIPSAQVYWYYAFAEYKDGKWVSQCSPSYKVKSKFMCK